MDDTLSDTTAPAQVEKTIAHERMPSHDLHRHGGSQVDSSIKTENLDLLMDVALHITVELGRRDMSFGEILRLGKGSIVELNKLADDPVDVYVNQSKVAEGEVVVVDEHFGVRITKLFTTERLKSAK
jgi:flagellar motor switch protein FliN/FliY